MMTKHNKAPLDTPRGHRTASPGLNTVSASAGGLPAVRSAGEIDTGEGSDAWFLLAEKEFRRLSDAGNDRSISDEVAEPLIEAANRIAEQIEAHPASGVGSAIKARLLGYWGGGLVDPEQQNLPVARLWRSLVADLEKLYVR